MPSTHKGKGDGTGATDIVQRAAIDPELLQDKLYTWVGEELRFPDASQTIVDKLRAGTLNTMGLYRLAEYSRAQMVDALQAVSRVGVHATSASAPDSGPHHLLLRLERS